MKKKIIFILISATMIIFASGITYSIFNSDASLSTSDQRVAEFIFNADRSNHIDIPLTGIKPGDEQNYEFAVTNVQTEKNSKVSINYQIIIKTFHFIPLVIELYDTNNEEDVIFGVCDETFSRNEQNELVCNLETKTLIHSSNELHNYRLRLQFPNEFNDEIYSGLVDYINLEIKSWQKIEG